MSNTATILQPCVHFPSLTCITNSPLIATSHYLRPSLRNHKRRSLAFPKSVKFNSPLVQVQFFDPSEDDEYDSEEEEDQLEDEFLALFTKRAGFSQLNLTSKTVKL